MTAQRVRCSLLFSDKSKLSAYPVLTRLKRPSTPQPIKTRQLVELAGFYLVAGVGFEPTTFRL